MSKWLQMHLNLPYPVDTVTHLSSKQIVEEFRIHPSEYFDFSKPWKDLEEFEIKEIERKIYQSKYNESQKSYKRNKGDNMRNSLFLSISTEWIHTPVELSQADKVICDGLHRIAVSYRLDPDKPIPVIFKDF
jgi:hypothetical protein